MKTLSNRSFVKSLNSGSLGNLGIQEILKRQNSFDNLELVELLTILAQRDSISQRHVFNALKSRVRYSSLRPQELTRVVWSCAKFNEFKGLEDLESRIITYQYDGNAWSQILWAYAKAQQGHAVFQSFLKLEHQLDKFSTRCLSNISWAFGRMKISLDTYETSIIQAFLARADEARPLHFANICWAVSMLHPEGQQIPLFSELFWKTSQVIVKSTEFSFRDKVQIFWAFARHRPRDSETLQTFQQIFSHSSSQFDNCQNVANLTFGLSRLPVLKCDPLKEAILKYFLGIRSFEEVCLRDLVVLTGSLASIWKTREEGIPQIFKILDRISRVISPRLTELPSKSLVNLLHAFSKVGYDPPELIETITSIKLGPLSSQDLAILGLAAVNLGNPALWTPILDQYRDRTFTLHGLSLLMYSYACCLQESPEFLEFLLGNINQFTHDDLRANNRINLFKAYVNERFSCELPLIPGDPVLRPSIFQAKVHQIATEVFTPKVLSESQPEASLPFWCDIVIPTHKTVIEVLGSSHFTGFQKKHRGTSQLRSYLLERKGWRSLEISVQQARKLSREELGEFLIHMTGLK